MKLINIFLLIIDIIADGAVTRDEVLRVLLALKGEVGKEFVNTR